MLVGLCVVAAVALGTVGLAVELSSTPPRQISLTQAAAVVAVLGFVGSAFLVRFRAMLVPAAILVIGVWVVNSGAVAALGTMFDSINTSIEEAIRPRAAKTR